MASQVGVPPLTDLIYDFRHSLRVKQKGEVKLESNILALTWRFWVKSDTKKNANSHFSICFI